jgi:hypothetical protein
VYGRAVVHSKGNAPYRAELITGGHFLESRRIQLGRQTQAADTNGVTEYRIKVFDPISRRAVGKERQSTMFPARWSEQQIKREVISAYAGATLRPTRNGGMSWTGVGPSGITISGYSDNLGRITSAYPIHNGRREKQ